jgi:hypothetical protein
MPLDKPAVVKQSKLQQSLVEDDLNQVRSDIEHTRAARQAEMADCRCRYSKRRRVRLGSFAGRHYPSGRVYRLVRAFDSLRATETSSGS